MNLIITTQLGLGLGHGLRQGKTIAPQCLKKRFRPPAVGLHLLIGDGDEVAHELRGHHQGTSSVPQGHLHADGAADGHDDPLGGAGDAGLPEAGRNGDGEQGLGGGDVEALNGDDEGLEPEHEVTLGLGLLLGGEGE